MEGEEELEAMNERKRRGEVHQALAANRSLSDEAPSTASSKHENTQIPLQQAHMDDYHTIINPKLLLILLLSFHCIVIITTHGITRQRESKIVKKKKEETRERNRFPPPHA